MTTELETLRSHRSNERAERFRLYREDHADLWGRNHLVQAIDAHFNVQMVSQSDERIEWLSELPATGLEALRYAGLFEQFVADHKGEAQTHAFMGGSGVMRPFVCFLANIDHMTVGFSLAQTGVSIYLTTVKSPGDLSYNPS